MTIKCRWYDYDEAVETCNRLVRTNYTNHASVYGIEEGRILYSVKTTKKGRKNVNTSSNKRNRQ
jgi:hypothetical protein